MNKLLRILALLGLPILALAQTNTLTTTTLSAAITQQTGSTSPAQIISVASATGINAPSNTNGTQGTALFIDREVLRVQSISGTSITVLRGQNGTGAGGHLSGATVWIGNPQWFQPRDPIGTCTLSTQYASPWINTITGEIFVCNALGQYGLAGGYLWLPPSSCWMTVGTATFASGPVLTRAAAGNQVLQATTSAATGTITLDCDIGLAGSSLVGYPGGVTVTGLSVLYGIQGSSMTSIATALVDSVTYPASTAAGVAAAGTVATLAGGTLTVTPTVLQLTTTTTGQCFNEFLSFGTPYVLGGVANQRLTFEQVFTTPNSETLQVCGLQLTYTTNPPAITPEP